MKLVSAGLQTSTTGSYDKTKTYLAGNVAAKTINSQNVFGPPLTKAIDVQTDAGFAPLDMYLTSNGRLFVVGAMTGAGTTLALYNFNSATGAATYVGKLLFVLPNTAATTHTLRGFKVDDSNTSNIKVFVATTGSVVINGGLQMIYGLALSDFVPVGFPTIFHAISSSAKGVYQIQDPAGMGVNNNITSAAGLITPSTYSADGTINTRAFVHNGVSATHQYYVFDYSIAPTITNYACTAPTAPASPTFTMAGHPFVANDPVVITASAPGGFTLTTASAVQTVYFVRNPAANTFELSATSGGASINATTAVTPTITRAFGQSTAMFDRKTNNLPALAGTLLLTNSEQYALPSHSANSGFACAAFGTTTNLYFGKLSELTSDATTWPSLVTSNITNTGIDITAPTPTFLSWGNTTDHFYYTTSTFVVVAKQLVNSIIRFVFGNLSNQYIETLNPSTLPYSLVATTGLHANQGWVFAAGSTAGQRVILALNARSDDYFGYSFITSPVIFTNNAVPKLLEPFEQLTDSTNSMNLLHLH